MSPIPRLTPAQQRALILLSAGSNATAIARSVGVHRNTIGNWLRSPGFRDALVEIRRDRDLAWRDQLRSPTVQACASFPAASAAPRTPPLPPPPSSERRPVRLAPPPATAAPKPGRNQPCPCGSGRKFKRCCGSTY